MIIWKPQPSAAFDPRLRYHPIPRWRIFLSFLPILIVAIAALVGVSQLTTIREFLSRATGEPANIMIDTTAILGVVPRPWQNLAQGGEQHDWRLEPLVGQVRALHPKYIRLDHIYDFYDIVQGSPGNLNFNFSKLDLILNDIQATGAKPYIALSYMPPVLSNGDVLGKPVRWEDWQLVVQKTIEHISGTRKTSDVYYEVWNEPDLFGDWKYYGDKNYLTLYQYAAQGAANARGVQAFKFGGPATTALYKNWFDALATAASEQNLRLDFFSWHRYSLDLDQYKQDMFDVRTWVQSYPKLESNLEFHITEWGHDSKNSPGYDSNFGAAQTVAAAIEMVNVVEHAFVFEIQDGKDPAGQPLWGRWGLFTSSEAGAQAKPRYYALRMLDRISGQRIQLLGKGTWVKALATKVDDITYQLVLANFDPAGRNSEDVPVTLQHLPAGMYAVNQEFLGGRKNTTQVATEGDTLQFKVVMSPSMVSFVEIKKQ